MSRYEVAWERLFRSMVLAKKTETTDIDKWGTTTVSFANIAIDGLIQIMTSEDILYLTMAGLKIGQAVGFFRPSYVVSSVTYTVEVGDKIVDGTDSWIVLSYVKQKDLSEDIVRECVLEREV